MRNTIDEVRALEDTRWRELEVQGLSEVKLNSCVDVKENRP